MEMPYDSRSIANYYIRKANEESIELTPMKLQKILYYTQGIYLALTGKRLINDQIEAWKFGPVFPEIYHSLKEFGMNHIDKEITYNDFDIFSDLSVEALIHPKPVPIPTDRTILYFLDLTWNAFKNKSAFELSDQTHEEGTPWYEVFHKEFDGNPPRGTDVPLDKIKIWFENYTQGQEENVL